MAHFKLLNRRNCSWLWNSVLFKRCMTQAASYSKEPPQVDASIESITKKPVGILPYSAIPGPRPLPVLGNKLLFTSLGGYPFKTFWSSCWKLHREYGPIVKVSKIASNLDLVFVFHPEDTRTLFLNEGPLPIRPPIDMLEYYRKSRSEWFSSAGLIPSNGPEWRRLRSAVQGLLKRDIVSKYRMKQASVCHDFVIHIKKQYPLTDNGNHDKTGYNIQNLLPLLFCYTLEAVGVVSLGTRLGCFSADGDDLLRSQSIISANADTLTVLGEALLKFPFYKYFPSKSFLRLAHAQDVVAKLMKEQLSELIRGRLSYPNEFANEQPFLDFLMDQPNLSNEDIFLLLVEVFQGGIDATATTLAFCIHYLSRDEEVQSLLYEEVKNIDPSTHNLQGLGYLRAVLQETFRLKPSATANGRIIHQDGVFSGYHVPAGTLVSSPPVIACRDEKVFPDPSEFKPQRWLSKQKRSGSASVLSETSSSQSSPKIHPYTVVPFGHGARMCPGRRLAEQEIYLLLIHLVQNFKMEQILKGEIGQVMRLNMMPDAPISVRFIPRS